MALFRYRAASSTGEISEGDLDVRDAAAALERVQANGLIPIRIEAAVSPTPSRQGLLFRSRVDQEQVGALTRELSTLLRSGLPLDRALEILIGLAPTPPLRSMLMSLRDEVRGGSSLSKAMEGHPRVFTRFYLGMIRAGEAGGSLGNVLMRIAEFMERSRDLRETVKSALIYPSILVVAAVVSVLLLLIFVVPQFSQMFEQSGKALPLPTQIVVGLGTAVRDYWWVMPFALFLAYQGFRWWTGDPRRRLDWDRRLLTFPIVGDLITKVEVARFARTLGTLLNGGIPLLAALAIVKDTVSNSAIGSGLDAAREQLKAGQGLSHPLMAQGVFPPLAVHLVSVGEETGRLDEMLERVADVYDREVSLSVRRLLALLEPVMILGLGLVIGGIIVSILLAILKVNSLVG